MKSYLKRRRVYVISFVKNFPDDVLLLSFEQLSRTLPLMIHDFRKNGEGIDEIYERLRDFSDVMNELRRRQIPFEVPDFIEDLSYNPLISTKSR